MNIDYQVIEGTIGEHQEYPMMKYGVPIEEIAQINSFVEKAYLWGENTKVVKRVSVIVVSDFKTWLQGGELALTTLSNFSTEQSQVRILKQLIEGGAVCLAFHPGVENKTKHEIKDLMIHKQTFKLAEKEKFPILLLRQDSNYADIIETVFKMDMDKQNRGINRLDLINKCLFNYISNNVGLQTTFQQIGKVIHKKAVLLDENLNLVVPKNDLNEDTLVRNIQTKPFLKFFNSEKIMWLLINKNNLSIKVEKAGETSNYLVTPIFQDEFLKYFLFIEDTVTDFNLKVLENISIALSMGKENPIVKQFDIIERACDKLFKKQNFKLAQTLFHQIDLPIETTDMLIVMEVTDFRGDQPVFTKNVKLRMKNFVEHYLKAPAFSGWYKDRFILFTQNSSIHDYQRFTQRLYEKMKHMFPNVNFIIGVSSPMTKDLIKSYEEALHAIMIGKNSKKTIVFFDEIGLNQILIDLKGDYYIRKFYEQYLNPILMLEPLRQKELLETLKMFIECNLNYKETAERLFIHPNTVRYRIKQIREVYKDDQLFTEAEKRFNLLLSLKLKEVLINKGQSVQEDKTEQ